MTEQEACDHLETLCGSIDRAFHIMRIHTSSSQDIDHRLSYPDRKAAAATLFRLRAHKQNFSDVAISHYLHYLT